MPAGIAAHKAGRPLCALPAFCHRRPRRRRHMVGPRFQAALETGPRWRSTVRLRRSKSKTPSKPQGFEGVLRWRPPDLDRRPPVCDDLSSGKPPALRQFPDLTRAGAALAFAGCCALPQGESSRLPQMAFLQTARTGCTGRRRRENRSALPSGSWMQERDLPAKAGRDHRMLYTPSRAATTMIITIRAE